MTSLSPPLQAILQLFKGPLSSVRFADIDATGLASSADEVEAAMSEVQRQETKLTELRQNLAQRQEALLVLAQQALAYARVYAENDEPLLEELNRISLPRAAKPRKPNAAKSTGGRDVVRAEPGAELAEPATEAEPDAEAEPEARELEAVQTLELESEAPAAESIEAAPRRTGRKARGSVPQRASN
jgi:hypothetical protein